MFGARNRRRQHFDDRHDAGRALAQLLDEHRGRDDVIVLGLARGGVPVAWEVAAALAAPLDAVIVRKLGAPGHEELALGAVAGGGHVIWNQNLLRSTAVTAQQLDDISAREVRELRRREESYRAGRPAADVADKLVILVDDGLATGASMSAAAQAVRIGGPARIVAAVPTAPGSVFTDLADVADDIVVVLTPEPFLAVGRSYADFGQVGDDEVRAALATPTC